jgi:acid phosphatase (class A)
MTHIKMLFLFLLSAIVGFSQTSTSTHYKTLARLSSNKSDERKALDDIKFPWAEYSKSAISYSFFRTAYLTAADEAKLSALINYPANSSDQTRAELDHLLALQNSRTPEQVRRAEYIANIGSWPTIIDPQDPDFKENRSNLFYIAKDIGDWYNPDNFPATTKLFMNCIQDIRVTEFRLKKHFVRARPYHLQPKLQPLARINSPSFPSGHSLWAFSEAFLFSEIIQGKKDNFMQKAEEVRWSRELMGIHYPSDNEASKVISAALIKFWYNSPQFKKDMEDAKAEWTSKKDMYKND